MNYKIIQPVLQKILMLLAAVIVIWLTFRMVRGNPNAFSSEALHKSFFTIGILTLILIGFIAVCVWLLRNFS